MPESVQTALLDVEQQPVVYEELPNALDVLTEYAQNQADSGYDDRLEAFRVTNIAIAHCLMNAKEPEIAAEAASGFRRFWRRLFTKQVSIVPTPLPSNYEDLYSANEALGKTLTRPGKTSPEDYRQASH